VAKLLVILLQQHGDDFSLGGQEARRRRRRDQDTIKASRRMRMGRDRQYSDVFNIRFYSRRGDLGSVVSSLREVPVGAMAFNGFDAF